MLCGEAQELIWLYLAPHPSWLEPEHRQALETHLAQCPACRREMEVSRKVIELVQRHYTISEDTKALIARAEQGLPPPGAAFRRFAWCSSAIAACLVVGLGLWLGLARWGVSPGIPESGPILAVSHGPAIWIEQLGPDGITSLEPGQLITTQAGQTKTLVLDGKHRLVMNAGTRLSIDPLLGDGNTGYLVNLRFGELFAMVEHDGNPFWVQTSHGRAVITGTTFDIKATDQGTTLVVAEGGVRFESEAGAVQVAAGQQSAIASASVPPSVPVACDTDALTAWAGPPAGEDTRLAQEGQNTSALEQLAFDLPVPSPWAEIQTNLDGLDLDKWASEKRAWFTGQFPWIFQFQDAVARTTNNEERTTAPVPDYTTLLMQSGDIWQFRYPQDWPQPIPVSDPNSMIRLASLYGLDQQWLIANALIPASMTHGEQPTTSNQQPETILKPFDDWATHLETGDWFVSDDAIAYLAKTRTLAILAIRRGLDTAPGETADKIVDLLQGELEGLAQCAKMNGELRNSRSMNPCDRSDKISRLAAGIRQIGQLETRQLETQRMEYEAAASK